MWNKKYFLKYLSYSKNPWAFEIELSKIAKNDGYFTLSTSNYNIDTMCVFPNQINTTLSQNHWPGKISIIGIKFEDIEYLIKKGYLNKNKLIYGSYNYYIDYNKLCNSNFNLYDFISKAPPKIKWHWINTFYKYM